VGNVSRIDDPDWRPRAADGVETDATPDGYIVYQPDRGRVHHLNQTAAILFALCTGQNRVTELPDLLRSALSLASSPAAETRACLEQFVAESLIV
jgi:hypothetical protein